MVAGALEVLMFANVARIAEDMKKARAVVEAGAKGMEAAAEGVKSALKAIAAGFTVHAIVSKIESVTEEMSKLKDASEKTGASVETLSQIKFFANVSGSSLEGVTGALAKLSKGMVSTGNEAAPTTQALKFLGLSAKDAAGNLKDPSALFGEIAQELIKYEDGAGKAAIAQALFGKAGAEILPTLKKMAELGAIEASVTTAQAQAAEDYQVKLALLHRQKEILWNTVVSALLPSMQSFVQMLLDASKETNSMGNAVKGLAADKSIESWADSGAMAIAVLIDAFKAIPGLASVAIAQVTAAIGTVEVLGRAATLANPATAAAAIAVGRNPVTEFKDALKAMNLAQADADAKTKAFLNSEVDATQRAMRRIIESRKAAALTADFWGPAPGGEDKKKLNFSLGDAAKIAAELKLFEGAVRQLEGELGKLTNETEVQKLAFQLYGKDVTLADGSVVHLTGSLEQLTAAHKRILPFLAQQVDMARATKVANEEFVKTLERIKADRLEMNQALAAEKALRDAGVVSIEKAIDQTNFETRALGMSTDERIRATAARELEAAGIGKLDSAYEGLLIRLTQAKVSQQTLRDALEAQKNVLDEMGEFAKEAARNIQRNLSDGLFDIMQGKFDNMGSRFKAVIDRMVADALAAKLGSTLFGDMDKTGQIGGLIGRGLESLGFGNKAPVSDAVLSSAKGVEETAAATAFSATVASSGALFSAEVTAAGVAFVPEVTAAGAAFVAEVAAAGASFAAMVAAGSGGSGAVGGIVDALLGDLGGFASGGSFRVGGHGGTDSQLVAFRASPNERVTVETPDQQGRQRPSINLNLHFAPGTDRATINQAAAKTGEMVQRAFARNG